MQALKHHIIIIIGLMMLGMVGRLVVGSIPFPEGSPFSVPSSIASVQSISHPAIVHIAASSAKKEDRHSGHGEGHFHGDRPWYGLEADRLVDYRSHLIAILPVPSEHLIPHPDLESAQRPPSC